MKTENGLTPSHNTSRRAQRSRVDSGSWKCSHNIFAVEISCVCVVRHFIEILILLQPFIFAQQLVHTHTHTPFNPGRNDCLSGETRQIFELITNFYLCVLDWLIYDSWQKSIFGVPCARQYFYFIICEFWTVSCPIFQRTISIPFFSARRLYLL